MADQKLSKINEAYIKKMEREKQVRELILSRMRKRNRYFLFGGLTTVFGIYCYTLYTVRQETFLDELDSEIAKNREKEQLQQANQQ